MSFPPLLTPTLSPNPDLLLAAPADVQRWVLVVPGSGGDGHHLLRLARSLADELAPGTGFALLNLNQIVASMPPPDLASATRQRLREAALALGPANIHGLVGYSVGGLMVLHLAEDLRQQLPPDVPIALLDTYAVERLARADHRWPRRLEAWLARRLARLKRRWQAGLGRMPRLMKDEFGGDQAMPPDLRQRWDDLHDQYRQTRWQPPTGPVLLLQADRARHEAALLWRRRSNGLRTQDLPRLTITRLPVGHLNMVRRAAPQVAVKVGQLFNQAWRRVGV